jgi:hypothetical protein
MAFGMANGSGASIGLFVLLTTIAGSFNVPCAGIAWPSAGNRARPPRGDRLALPRLHSRRSRNCRDGPRTCISARQESRRALKRLDPGCRPGSRSRTVNYAGPRRKTRARQRPHQWGDGDVCWTSWIEPV